MGSAASLDENKRAAALRSLPSGSRLSFLTLLVTNRRFIRSI